MTDILHAFIFGSEREWVWKGKAVLVLKYRETKCGEKKIHMKYWPLLISDV